MVGVTSPVFRNRRFGEGSRLLGGYLVGTGLASVLVALAVTLLSAGVAALLPSPTRGHVLVIAFVVLLVLDASGRMIFLNRQTPQRARLLPPFARGMIWGLDIGLLVTTIKVTSLVWALLILILAEPSFMILALVTYYSVNLVSEGIALLIDYKLKGRLFEELHSHTVIGKVARGTSFTLLTAGVVLMSAVAWS